MKILLTLLTVIYVYIEINSLIRIFETKEEFFKTQTEALHEINNINKGSFIHIDINILMNIIVFVRTIFYFGYIFISNIMIKELWFSIFSMIVLAIFCFESEAMISEIEEIGDIKDYKIENNPVMENFTKDKVKRIIKILFTFSYVLVVFTQIIAR